MKESVMGGYEAAYGVRATILVFFLDTFYFQPLVLIHHVFTLKMLSLWNQGMNTFSQSTIRFFPHSLGFFVAPLPFAPHIFFISLSPF